RADQDQGLALFARQVADGESGAGKRLDGVYKALTVRRLAVREHAVEKLLKHRAGLAGTVLSADFSPRVVLRRMRHESSCSDVEHAVLADNDRAIGPWDISFEELRVFRQPL